MKKMIAPSLLSADFARLRDEIEMLNASEADWIHLDIMDGVFVPNISFGFPVLEAVRRYAKKPLDIHLMIVEPQKFVRQFADLNPYMLNVHYEACTHLHRTVQQIRDAGVRVGVTLNPHTPVSLLEDIVGELDMVLLMSVNPGFGGQKFIENTYEKVSRLRELIGRKNASALIEVDGGVNSANAPKLFACGADVLVAGSFVFKADSPAETIAQLRKA